jgi:hypothetical protein
MLLLGRDSLLPIRVVAVMALPAVIGPFIYVLRHLKNIERMMKS